MARTSDWDFTDLDDAVIICRTLGHAWDENPNAEIDTDFSQEFLIALRCTRCPTERFDFVGATGKLFHRYYRYPESYHTHRIPREAFRGEMVGRSLLIHNYRKRKMKKAS